MKKIDVSFDVLTGEETVIEREETAKEVKERLDHAKKIAAIESEAEAKATAKAELLAKLGISDEEAKLLLS